MIIVSNTSPIINLAAIDKLELLKQLYDKIYIPEAVNFEIRNCSKGKFPILEIYKLGWIDIIPISNKKLFTSLSLELDYGESEAIILSLENKAGLLLIDERKGRNVASRFDIKCIGVLGILMESKHKGIIPKLEPLINDLISKAGFWMSSNLIQKVLETAGEL